MRLQQRHKSQPVIPTASMADIAFLLIIFFMVTMNFEKDRTQVALPKTDLRFEIPKLAAYISVTGVGQIKVTTGEEMSAPVGPEDVVSFAANLVALDPTRPIVIKADADVPYEKIDKILDSLKQARVENIYLLSDQKTVAGDGKAGG